MSKVLSTTNYTGASSHDQKLQRRCKPLGQFYTENRSDRLMTQEIREWMGTMHTWPPCSLGERVSRRDEPVRGERRRGLDAAATATKRQQRWTGENAAAAAWALALGNGNYRGQIVATASKPTLTYVETQPLYKPSSETTRSSAQPVTWFMI
jgi:hypothetical protein